MKFLRGVCLLIILTLASIQSNADGFAVAVEQRLEMMKQVAAYKWEHDISIHDPARERQVLDHASAQSLRYGLRVDTVRVFFSAQMAAAREIQEYWFDRWRRGVDLPEGEAPDLGDVIRPRLIVLGEEIMGQLADTETNLAGIEVEGLTPESLESLARSARAVNRYDNAVDQILDAGLLRVGTTADYAPFSSGQFPDELQGVDIAMARDLALSLGVDIQWVSTTWTTLMDDLHAGNFDIGMSGISINLQRQRSALFSLPYHTGGKTPIARCEDAPVLNSLEAIDQPSVRVVVNPGGTNEGFTEENIHRASVRVHPDNRTVFHEILAQRADVMITDQVEVKLQSAKHAGLCATMPGQTLTFSQKAYLLPRDMVWKTYIDTWLAQRKGEQVVAKYFDEYLK